MEQAPRQEWQPDRYAANARFVADLGAPVVELLAPRPGERILDLGCGDGALTERLAAFGCKVIGVDAGPEMVAATRRRGLEAYVADGQDLRFVAEFDAVFSNAALHWMRDADAMLRGVRRALRPGGRFVGEFGGTAMSRRSRSRSSRRSSGAGSTATPRSRGISRRPRPTRRNSRPMVSRSTRSI